MIIVRITNLVSATIKHRAITFFITVLLSLFGLWAFYQIPKQESPDVTPPIALITTIYPGASPGEVEKLVTSVIEERVSFINGYKSSQSYSQNSVSAVVVELSSDAPVENAWAELRRTLSDAQVELPAECFPIKVNTELATTAGVIVSLSGDRYSPQQLADRAEEFKKRLVTIDGIQRFDIQGNPQRHVKVELDAARLNQSHLSLEEILKILQAQNVVIPPGTVEENGTSINVKISGYYTSTHDIENTIVGVSSQTGTVIRLKDLGRVYWTTDPTSIQVRQNGKKAVLLAGYFKDDKNILFVGQKVREKLDRLKASSPRDLVVDEVLFQPDDVRTDLNHFLRNLLEGILLVIIVVLLGMGWKNALIASTAIPLSVLLTFGAMSLLGIKIHEISIAALIIVLGILVDDAIVMVDAIQVHLDKGENRLTACLNGVQQAAIPILAATVVIIISFSPLFALPGAPGEFLRSIPQIVLLSLLASYLVAMLVTPAMAYVFFRKSRSTRDSLLRKLFVRLLNLTMRRRKLAIAGVLIAFGLAVFAGQYIPLQFFPKADKDMLYINFTANAGTTTVKMEQLVSQVEQILASEEKVMNFTTAIGSGLPKFYVTVPVTPQAPNVAQLMMHVKPGRKDKLAKNEDFANYLQIKINQGVSGGKARVKLLEKAYPVSPIQVRLTEGSLTRMQEAADIIKQKLAAINGTLNIDDDIEAPIKQYVINIDKDKASLLGISNYDVQRQVNIALQGSKATVLRSEENQCNIIVASNIRSLNQLNNLAIKSTLTGNKAPLQTIAQINTELQEPSIKKYNGELATTVTSETKSGYSAVEIEKALKEKLAGTGFKRVKLFYEGETKQITDNFGMLAKAALVALALIYVILMIQFKSLLQPLVIFLTLPLALIGSVIGLLICRQPLSFTAFVGMISLAGLVIRNAILLIEFINQARAEGMSIDTACKDAVDKRFRSIILTAVTATIGLVPLALSGSNLFVPLAVTLMFGLLVATVLTMVIIPLVYSMIIRDPGGSALEPEV